MAHYALLNENNIVTEVITGRNENEIVDGISDWEIYYGEFHNKPCKRTSYNTLGNVHINGETPFRGNYAGINYYFDQTLDAFIPPKCHDSATLNEQTFLWVCDQHTQIN
jgi:hypothetical protein